MIFQCSLRNYLQMQLPKSFVNLMIPLHKSKIVKEFNFLKWLHWKYTNVLKKMDLILNWTCVSFTNQLKKLEGYYIQRNVRVFYDLISSELIILIITHNFMMILIFLLNWKWNGTQHSLSNSLTFYFSHENMNHIISLWLLFFKSFSIIKLKIFFLLFAECKSFLYKCAIISICFLKSYQENFHLDTEDEFF